jgi:sigma-B regulation protein RsbU (phosphoserine phosphatase)
VPTREYTRRAFAGCPLWKGFMDSIFYLGRDNDTLPTFLQKLGYTVIEPSDQISLPEFVSDAHLDLILIDGRVMGDVADLCTFFHSQQSTRSVPIVCITEEMGASDRSGESGSRVEIIQAPFTVGSLVSRIAMMLRLRKLAGNDERQGSLAEINASLRDNNLKFKKELDEARAIQQSLLPVTLPKDSRIDLAVSYQPLDEVGGDWYFANQSGDKQISLQIADVSGHGLSAAFIGSMAKLAMTAADRDQPHELLMEMNRLLAPQIPAGRFVTMGSCLYDPATGKVSWARAGHPPALIVRRASNTVAQMLGDGFAVGFFEDSSYMLVEDTLEVGDALLMFTDGITEAQDRSGDAFGLQRLSEALLGSDKTSSCSDILRHILDIFDQFRGERLIRDDVTLLLLKRSA